MFRRRRTEHDFNAEIEAHVQLEVETLREQGLSEDEARAQAFRTFGNVTQVRERFYESGRWLWWDHLWQDVGFGARMLARSPCFTAVAVLTLALGIGANTAIFSALDAVLLKPLPFQDPDRLLLIRKRNPPRGWNQNPISPPEILAWHSQTAVFEDLAAFTRRSCVLTGAGDAEEAPCELVSSTLFPLLGATPLRGRGFLLDEDRPEATRAAILSYGLWQRRFGGDEGLIGRAITVNGARVAVVGVMPATFSHRYAPPYMPIPELWLSGIALSPLHAWNDYFAVGRLKPAITVSRAQAEMDAVSARLDQVHPDLKGWRAEPISLRESVSGDTRVSLVVLMGAVAFVLLIACANLANLLLARGASRASEFAVRSALGAGQRRLVRQLLTESLLISLVGGALGILVALLGREGLAAIAPPVLLRAASGLTRGAVDFRVLGFALFAAVTTAVLFGLAPALQSTRSPLTDTLKETGRNAVQGPRSRRFRSGLVVTEIALAMVLLVGAGLMVRTLAELRRLDLGFEPTNVLTLRVPLSGARYEDPRVRVAFWQQVVSAVEALPGVEAATVSRGLPIGDWAGHFFVTADDPNPPAGQVPDANYVVAGTRYFQILHIPLRRGRSFDEHDTHSAERVVIVNDELARRYWPGEDPLGKRLRIGAATATWLTVVGVAGNVLSQGPSDGFHAEAYVPYQQFPWLVGGPQHLLLRTSATLKAKTTAHDVVRAIQGVDKDQPVTDIRTLEEAAGELMAHQRLVMALLVSFAVAALVLAASGVYGVLSYSIAQRTREIGVRVALGADRSSVIRLVVGGGARLAALGIVLGTFAALAASRLMADLLFGVRATDAATFAGVTLVLAVTSLLACYIPARRATKVDPIVALRHE